MSQWSYLHLSRDSVCVRQPIGAIRARPSRVRQALNDFESQGAPLLAVFERWEALVFPPHGFLRLAGSVRVGPWFVIK